MSRIQSIFLTVCVVMALSTGRYTLELRRTPTIQFHTVQALSLTPFCDQPCLPVTSVDLDEVYTKTRTYLSMLNSVLRRFRKRFLISLSPNTLIGGAGNSYKTILIDERRS